jgi:hypothetical protein
MIIAEFVRFPTGTSIDLITTTTKEKAALIHNNRMDLWFIEKEEKREDVSIEQWIEHWIRRWRQLNIQFLEEDELATVSARDVNTSNEDTRPSNMLIPKSNGDERLRKALRLLLKKRKMQPVAQMLEILTQYLEATLNVLPSCQENLCISSNRIFSIGNGEHLDSRIRGEWIHVQGGGNIDEQRRWNGMKIVPWNLDPSMDRRKGSCHMGCDRLTSPSSNKILTDKLFRNRKCAI